MAPSTREKGHHHGDLRNALIGAGIAILQSEGLEGLSLRKCAARAGVSHAAPAHHFDGIAGLRAAIAEEGFARFRRTMLEARARGGQTPHERLKSICRGYMRFALREPALFGLIFSFDAWSISKRGLDEDSASSYQVLRETCVPFVPTGQDPVIVETRVWSLVHGYAVLSLSGRFGPVGTGDNPPGPFEKVLAMLDDLPLANPA